MGPHNWMYYAYSTSHKGFVYSTHLATWDIVRGQQSLMKLIRFQSDRRCDKSYDFN